MTMLLGKVSKAASTFLGFWLLSNVSRNRRSALIVTSSVD